MRPTILLGSALTAGVLTTVAVIISAVVAVDQASVTSGVITRTFLVVAALAVTAFIWWTRMRPNDAPEGLFLGLVIGWAFNLNSWAGASFAGQLVTDLPIASALVDLVLWAGVAFLLVLALSRTSGSAVR
jgi:hypothetical protein